MNLCLCFLGGEGSSSNTYRSSTSAQSSSSIAQSSSSSAQSSSSSDQSSSSSAHCSSSNAQSSSSNTHSSSFSAPSTSSSSSTSTLKPSEILDNEPCSQTNSITTQKNQESSENKLKKKIDLKNVPVIKLSGIIKVYFGLRFVSANAINNYLLLKIRLCV